MRLLPPVIGLMGNFGVGKNTFANFLAMTLDYKVIAFADPIYKQMEILNPFIVEAGKYYEEIVAEYEQTYHNRATAIDRAKREIPEIRRWLKAIGTEVGRVIYGEDCWIRLLDETRGNTWEKVHTKTPTVIPDVRFPNEVEYVHSQGGIMVLIEEADGYVYTPGDHESEAMNFADYADYRFSNTSNVHLVVLDLIKTYNEQKNRFYYAIPKIQTCESGPVVRQLPHRESDEDVRENRPVS